MVKKDERDEKDREERAHRLQQMDDARKEREAEVLTMKKEQLALEREV
jgi:hypothetical protein